MRALLRERIGDIAMDEGERDLAAYILTQDTNAICGPDNALVRATSRLNIAERMWSLEQVLSRINTKSKTTLDLKNTTHWLQTMKTRCPMEGL